MNKHLFIAYHEAGHAILALLNNCNIDNVKASKMDGIAYYEYDSSLKLSNHKQVQILYGGFIAESYLSNTLNQQYKLKTGCASDLSKIKTLLKNNKNLNEKAIFLLADKKIRKHWSDVTLIANKLLNDSKISQIELFGMLCSYSSKQAFWLKKLHTIQNKYSK